MKKNASIHVGTRPSQLAKKQAKTALNRIEGLLTNIHFTTSTISSVGDSDRNTDLRESPADFFTRELDEAILNHTVDMAVHSAKDLPSPPREGIDWFWLPWREEPRDVMILKKGVNLDQIPKNPIIGVSSERRAEFCTKRFPKGIQKTIRGNIEERIEALDQGEFDILIMAAAALVRLSLEDRISEWIDLEDLEVPEAQGYLAVTFRKGDTKLIALRNLFIKSVTFAGAGINSLDNCSVSTLKALRRADLCLYDSRIDTNLLRELPPDATAIDVKERFGPLNEHQIKITKFLCQSAKEGKRIVRLKTGDPGIFGRIDHEIKALTALKIPFRVTPGISAIQVATTTSGMLLTRHETSRGFCTITPRKNSTELAPCNSTVKSKLPVVYFMSLKAVDVVVEELLNDRWPADTPAALVLDAGGPDQIIVRTSLAQLTRATHKHYNNQPGLIIVGDITAHSFNSAMGALLGRKVLLTCSEALQEKATAIVRDYGGDPIQYPLIRLTPQKEVQLRLKNYDWIIISSPSAVRCFLEIIKHQKIDLRSIPKIIACGKGTAHELERANIPPDVCPEKEFSADSIIETAKKSIEQGEKVLRLRSQKASQKIATKLAKFNIDVDDMIIYVNEIITPKKLPNFDTVFFASTSAVNAFINQWGTDVLNNKALLSIGQPTTNALSKKGLKEIITANESTTHGALETLAAFKVSQQILNSQHPLSGTKKT